MGAAAFGQKVTIEFDQAADFAKYKTFALRDGQLNSKNPALNSELVKKQIENDIVWVGAEGGVGVVSGRVVRVPYTEGTLVIDFQDRSTRLLVWRGIASEEKSDGAKIEGKLDAMVRKVLRSIRLIRSRTWTSYAGRRPALLKTFRRVGRCRLGVR